MTDAIRADRLTPEDFPAPDERQWVSRIVGSGEEDPEQLLANPRNWRIHPRFQQEALGEALDRIGWVQQVIVNRTTGHVVDGHLRVQLAITRGEPVPVVYVDLTEEEEAVALATLDPLAALAATDDSALRGLLSDLDVDLGPQLAEMLDKVSTAKGSVSNPNPSGEDLAQRQKEMAGQFDKTSGDHAADLVSVTCPGCGEDFAISRSELTRYN